ncbi:HEAT repeat domain-containing protein [Myxococcota bacterium]|nr:HEAT repeat domain-containing protein [Myxococcota bacterium]MBU1537952.1 HEAT repeat domain-containing protein [Myxococcota bacterium]
MRQCPACGRDFDVLAAGFTVISGGTVTLVCSERCTKRIQGPHLASQYLCPTTTGSGHANLLVWARKALTASVLALAFIAVIYMIVHALSEAEPRQSEIPFHTFTQVRSEGRALFSVTVESPKIDENIQEKTEEYQLAAQKILTRLLTSPCNSLWEVEGIDILASHGNKEALAKLKKLLIDDDGPRRRKVAHALARLGDKEAVIILRDAMRSKNSAVSTAAAFSLGELGDQTALKYLKQLMSFKQTRFSAAESVLYLGWAPAREYLFNMASKGHRSGDRVRAALSLAKAGDLRASAILLKALHDGTSRYLAAMGLAYLGKKEAIPVLNQAIKHISLRIEAAKYLARLGNFDSIADLQPLMASEFMPQRITAASAMFILTSRKLTTENNTTSNPEQRTTWLAAGFTRIGTWLQL